MINMKHLWLLSLSALQLIFLPWLLASDNHGNQTEGLSVNDEVIASSNKSLYLGGLLSLGSEPDMSGILPAVELALEHINEDPDILGGYVLKLEWENTRVSYQKDLVLLILAYEENIENMFEMYTFMWRLMFYMQCIALLIQGVPKKR